MHFMNLRSLRRFLPVLLLAVLMVVLVAAIGPAAAAPLPLGRMVNIQILAVNDFHGALKPPGTIATPTGNVNAGGAEYLSTWIKSMKSTNSNTVVVSAGDMIGASPLLSALFHDEPSIETFNEIGLDFNAVGNHEFDEGLTELLRMQNGGCHPVDGCADGDPFEGADFRYLAANVVYEGTNRAVLPAYRIKQFSGVKVAFIGMTLEATPGLVSPSGIAGLEFKDEADTVNRLVKILKGKGVKAFVVLLHEGGYPAVATEYNGCSGISGPIVDIVERTSDDVDLRSYPPGLQLRHRRPRCDQRRLQWASRHPRQHECQPQDQGSHRRYGRERHCDADCGQGPGYHGPDRQV
jgi:5'-nucleotidase